MYNPQLCSLIGILPYFQLRITAATMFGCVSHVPTPTKSHWSFILTCGFLQMIRKNINFFISSKTIINYLVKFGTYFRSGNTVRYADRYVYIVDRYAGMKASARWIENRHARLCYQTNSAVSQNRLTTEMFLR